jgi:glycosyltransferase involved in cell wall biosynthesis
MKKSSESRVIRKTPDLDPEKRRTLGDAAMTGSEAARLGDFAPLRVAMVSSVHRWNDTRIFVKEAISLAQAGYHVVLVGVANERESFKRDGLQVHTLRRRRRSLRWINWLAILRIVIAERAVVVHAHDPELFPLVVFLKLTGRKAVCDVHEDFAQQVLNKEWIPTLLRGVLSKAIRWTDHWLPRVADAVILAEDSYKRNFPPRPNVMVVRNFPLLPDRVKLDYRTNVLRLIYVGDVRMVRGIDEYVRITDALARKGVPVELNVVGSFADPEEEKQIKALVQQLGLQDKVVLLGRRAPEELPALVSQCDVGLALLHPIGNYRESYPTKMFEYMAGGLPVVASRFALWESVLVGNNCGRVVDPLNVAEASEVLFEYWNSLELRELHGRNGRAAVEERYHWDLELPQLLGPYRAWARTGEPLAGRG